MDKLKRFVECYIPTEACNLRCDYCYITQERKFNNKIAKFEYSPEYIRQALSVNRLGGICLFNIVAGGETLLSAELIDVVVALLEEGHYVMIVTNGLLTNRLLKFSNLSEDLQKRLFFKISFHYLELKKNNLFDKFFNNVRLIAESKCSYSVELTPSDEMIPFIPEIKDICMRQLGALCHVTVARDDRSQGKDLLSAHGMEVYKDIWGTFNSDLFDFKTHIFGKKRREYCYAGDWSIVLDLVTGDIKQCYAERYLGNAYQNIDEPLVFSHVGSRCSQPHCYNGHAFLTLGTIPTLDTPSYAQMRDQKPLTGRPWLGPEMRDFMKQRLRENNQQKHWAELLLENGMNIARGIKSTAAKWIRR